jgi:hypothetical protein
MIPTWLCRHKTVKVIRWHASCVPAEWIGKELYVDTHDVVNLVQCCGCGTILQGAQTEPLFASK